MDCKANADCLSWKAIVITCTSTKIREALEEECNRLSRGDLLPKHEFLFIVDDPHPENGSQKVFSKDYCGVGSGGATINSLLVAIERLSAYHNHTTVNSELVYNSRILVVHHGRSLVHSPGGSPFLHIDAEKSYVPPKLQIVPPTLLQHAIWMATKVGSESQNGVWVISMDVFLPYSSSLKPPKTEGLDGTVICTVNAPLDHAQHHGIIVAGEEKGINKLHYKMPHKELEKVFTDQNAPVISGLVFLSASLTEKLLGLHMFSPLDRCTYYGMDSGIPPLQVSLYFDLLAPLCSGVKEEEYLLGHCGSNYAKVTDYDASTLQESQMARLQIWKVLKGLRAEHHPLNGVSHHYLGSHLPFKDSLWPLLPHVCTTGSGSGGEIEYLCKSSFVDGHISSLNGKVSIMDSLIGKDVKFSCKTTSSFSGFHIPYDVTSLNFPDDFVWQCYMLKENCTVVCYGMNDKLTQQYEEAGGTLFNVEYSVFFKKLGIGPDDLWPEIEQMYRTPLNAKLFLLGFSTVDQMKMLISLSNALKGNEPQFKWSPQQWRDSLRVSLFETTKTCDLMQTLRMRDIVHLEIMKRFIHVTSDDVGGKSLLPLFNYIASKDSKYLCEILHLLHSELQQPRPSTARLLANIADLLGCKAMGRGGLRSGPAANPLWRNALLQLKIGNQKESVEHLFEICQKWISSGHPEDLIRAARHYERASQIVISREVETAQANMKIPWELSDLHQLAEKGHWVEAQSPARFDIAGGWSDTPPICYEQGGAVLNIAVKVNGQKPIGAKVRFIEEPHLVCTLRDWSGGDLMLNWTELEHLRDYDNPVAQGALVKAVLLYCRVVDLSCEETLSSQLKEKYGGGIELEVWSLLPQGSGLGGSSLLAGTLVAALAVLFGYPMPQHSHLIHATLVIEQWLTTGGGWQDQVGGLVGGAKLGVSKKGTPLTVTTYKLPLSQSFVATLNKHLLLLYTGKVRLARNLLQTVIRNWYARDDTVIECFSKLPFVAVSAAKSMLMEDLKALGTCIDEYWSLKKQVASGCEPLKVSNLMASMRDHCFGMSLAGAGGGGYLYALKTKPNPLPETIDLGDLVCDVAEIDEQGLEIKKNGKVLPYHAEGEEMYTLSSEMCKELLNFIQ